MECLVKIYDTEQINNLISILAFKPQSVVFLYDRKLTEEKDLTAVETACTNKVENINFEFVNVNSQNLYDIVKKCKNIIRRKAGCVFDITGGEELTVIGMYLCCVRNFAPVYKINIDSCEFINVYGCNQIKEMFTPPELDLETVLASTGARIERCCHPTPDEYQFNDLMSFCNVVFNDIYSWKELCIYIQNGMKNSKGLYSEIQFYYEKNSADPKTKISINSEKILISAEKFSLIKDLELRNDCIKFIFSNIKTEKYMTDFGSWLEIYTYITLKKSNVFRDVKLSAKIEWDSDSRNNSKVTNEIDVTFFQGITPVFVSCKLSDPNAEALQELSIYRNYFGGRRSKCILVTTSNLRVDKPHIITRAHEMDIHIIDRNDIISGTLLDKIELFLGVASKNKNM